MSGDNPYKAPSAELETAPSGDGGDVILREPRTVGPGRGFRWLGEALQMFLKFPLPWAVSGVIFFGLSMLASFIPVVGGVMYTLVSSVMFGGVMLGCAAQEFGEDYSISYLFVAFANPYKLLLLSVIYMVVAYTVIFVVLGPLGREILTGGFDPAMLEGRLEALRTPMLITTVLLIPLFMAMWFAAPLVMLHDESVGSAMRLSLIACLRNILPMMVFTIVLAGLFFIGMLPLFLGLLVVYPMMIIATYTGYRDIFTHEEVGSK